MRVVRSDEDLSLDGDDLVISGDNADVLPQLPSDVFDLIYIDPPFNTGSTRRHVRTRAVPDPDGHAGFGGRSYASRVVSSMAFDDDHADYLEFIGPKLDEARRLLAPHGTLYFHIDHREAHYCKVLLDDIFGRECFLNEIIWAYDYGGRSKRRWPAKHDTILVYVKDPTAYHFDSEEVDREPYMAPGLVTAEKRERGKLPTDCYSDDTEVLTRGGWLDFERLTDEQELATVTADGELVYARPTRVHAHRYRGSMIRFAGKMTDLLVTPSHSMLVRPKNAKHFEFRAAQDLEGGASTYFSLRKRLRWDGARRRERFELPSVPYARERCLKPLPSFELEDWCEFIGWYLAEGSFGFYGDNATVTITQTKDPAKIERIGALLEAMGLSAWYDGRGFVLNNKQLATYLSQFGRSHEKHVPRELLELDRGCLERLYEGLMLGDGYRRFDDGRLKEAMYTTVSPRLADDVQELFIKLGWGTSMAFDWSGPAHWRPRYRVAQHMSDETTIWPSRHRQEVDYDGMVYCATIVPTHTLIVRRGGAPVVCGNCWWHTIVATNGEERTGYPTQKPEGIVRRMVAASSRPGGWCLDFFAGSGTLGAVCRDLDRRYVLVDSNPEAIDVMRGRLC